MRKLLVSFFCVGRLAALCAAAGMPAIDSRVPPLFTGHVMTNETVLFMGTDDVAPLMYKADEILSVTSFDLKTEYKEGVDWTFDRVTRTIRPTPNTRMPYYKESEWYPAKGRFRCVRPGKPFVFFSEGSVISLHQVCVTYRHSDSWDGPVPRSDAAAFAPLLARLSKRTGGKTLFYGDSITTGGNSSGKVGFDPHIPSWPEQVHAEIAAATGNSGLEYVNTAVGGKNSQWGVANVKARVIDHAPDFVLIAFGMNDRLSAADYSAKTAAMVDAIHAALPQTAILLVPPMVPNLEVKGLTDRDKLFPEYEKALCALVEKYHAAGFAQIGCANVNTMHAAVLARKRYRDMTGNNINHCNDFSARIYRDAILAAMGLPKKPASDWKPRRTGRCATGSTGAWRRDGRMRRPRSAATGALPRDGRRLGGHTPRQPSLCVPHPRRQGCRARLRRQGDRPCVRDRCRRMVFHHTSSWRVQLPNHCSAL